jgi:D-alanyl-D-alanine carboxypeptidase
MGCDKLEQRYRDAIAIFEAGFNELKITRTLFSKNFDVFSTTHKKVKGLIKAAVREDVAISYYASEEPLVRPKLEWNFKNFPIEPGQELGKLSLYDQNNHILRSYPLHALEKVRATFYYQALDKCYNWRMHAKQFFPLLMLGVGLAIIVLSFTQMGRRS